MSITTKKFILSIKLMLVAMGISQSSFSSENYSIYDESKIFIEEYRELKKHDLEDSQIRTTLLNNYNGLSWKAIDSFSNISNRDIQSIFEILNLVTFFTNDTLITRKFAQVAFELRHRGLLNKSQSDDTLKSLISARLFEDADYFRKNYTENSQPTPILKNLIDTPTQSLIEISDDSNLIERKEFKFPSGGFVIIVGAPLCHFSLEATEAIDSDILLSSRLAGRVRWIAPQSRGASFDSIRQWNEVHPNTKFSIAYQASEWPQISSWETPNFYFFRDGILVEKLTGWRPGYKNKLEVKLESIGL
jgi:hypothetical protein